MSVLAPVTPVPTAPLPDPVLWVTRLVEVVGEARRGTRPWTQVFPLLDLPVVTQVWPQRRVRYPASWRVVKVLVQSPATDAREVVVLIREDLRYRVVAVRLEAAARDPKGHWGPPGRRLTPLTQLPRGRRPEGWIATAFTVL